MGVRHGRRLPLDTPAETSRIVSYAIAVMPALRQASINCRSAAKWKYVSTNCPGRMRGHSVGWGSFTLTISSACDQTSTWVAIVPPTAAYSSSVMPEPAPAPVSTSTVCPAAASTCTPAGTMPTRYSSVFSSCGTPMIMVNSLRKYRPCDIAATPLQRDRAANASEHPMRRGVICLRLLQMLAQMRQPVLLRGLCISQGRVTKRMRPWCIWRRKPFRSVGGVRHRRFPMCRPIRRRAFPARSHVKPCCECQPTHPVSRGSGEKSAA